jgi:hypothetical protein
LLTNINMNRAIKLANNNMLLSKPKKIQSQFPLIIFHILYHNSSIFTMPISNVRSDMTNHLFKMCTR